MQPKLVGQRVVADGGSQSDPALNSQENFIHSACDDRTPVPVVVTKTTMYCTQKGENHICVYVGVLNWPWRVLVCCQHYSILPPHADDVVEANGSKVKVALEEYAARLPCSSP